MTEETKEVLFKEVRIVDEISAEDVERAIEELW